ncbi:MAG: hypothetical protein ABIA21_01545, partial [Candidatus Aenigmatarchaeota archaeon]
MNQKLLPVLIAVLLVFVLVPTMADSETTLGTDIDNELQAYQNADMQQEQTQVATMTQSTITNIDRLAEKYKLSVQERIQYKKMSSNLEEKQYVSNYQLKLKLAIANEQGQQIIEFVKEKGKTASELETIKQKIQELKNTINVEDINTAAFSSKLNEIRNLTTQFKEMVQNQLTVEERNEIRNRV